jgi:CheY-like chemotaxis protein
LDTPSRAAIVANVKPSTSIDIQREAAMTQPLAILVVDDEAPIVTLITEALTDERYTVHIAEDGGSGLRAIAEHRPALILLDNMMPGLSGLEMLALLQQAPEPAPPIIMMSAAMVADACLS